MNHYQLKAHSDAAGHWSWLYAMGVMLTNVGVLYIVYIAGDAACSGDLTQWALCSLSWVSFI